VGRECRYGQCYFVGITYSVIDAAGKVAEMVSLGVPALTGVTVTSGWTVMAERLALL
jgi:hypothetical protein